MVLRYARGRENSAVNEYAETSYGIRGSLEHSGRHFRIYHLIFIPFS
jgi:hypothetical protein